MNDLLERAKKVKVVALDGDGVFFTGRTFIAPGQGELLKERSHVDGQGISLLRADGIRIALVSGEKTGFIETVAEKLNSLPSVKDGKWSSIVVFTGPQSKDKVNSVGEWLKSLGIDWNECAYMGDDISDYEILKKAGLSAAPHQAEEIIKNIVHYVAPRNGGDGAIRDLANLILEAQKVDITSLSLR